MAPGRVVCAGLLVALLYTACVRAQEPNTCSSFSVTCTPASGANGRITVAPTCKVAPGAAAPGAQAWVGAGSYANQTGWNFLKVNTIEGNVTDLTIPFAAGFIEAATFVDQTTAFWENYQEIIMPITVYNDTLMGYINNHLSWVYNMIETNQTVYWQSIGWFYRQMEGFVYGYNSAKSPDAAPLDFLAVVLLNMQGDIWDIATWMKVVHPPVDFKRPGQQKGSHKVAGTQNHCSSFIKWLPDGSDVYASHTTWASFATMNRVWKIYNFSVAEWPGKVVQQSSYPLTIASVDDYYQIAETQLMVTETTLSVYVTEIYKKVTPYGLMASGVRAPLANRLATSAESWTTLFGLYNSGTYNNQWIVVDYKLFREGEPLDNNILWVSEQMPGFYAQASMVDALRYGLYPSYNEALFPETKILVGMGPAVAKDGVFDSYDLAPRAQIFRRQGNTATNFTLAQQLLHYNEWKTDPLSYGDPCNAIACREDLEPKNPQAFGAIDGKLTNSSLVRSGRVSIIGAPTHQTQPTFCWSTSSLEVQLWPHRGQPDCFNFDWLIVDQSLECGYQP